MSLWDHISVTACNTNFHINKLCVFTCTLYVCFVWFSELSLIIYVNSGNWLVFVMEMQCFLCSWTELLLCAGWSQTIFSILEIYYEAVWRIQYPNMQTLNWSCQCSLWPLTALDICTIGFCWLLKKGLMSLSIVFPITDGQINGTFSFTWTCLTELFYTMRKWMVYKVNPLWTPFGRVVAPVTHILFHCSWWKIVATVCTHDFIWNCNSSVLMSDCWNVVSQFTAAQ